MTPSNSLSVRFPFLDRMGTRRHSVVLLPPGAAMFVLGVVLLLLGWLTGVGILTTLGVILLVVGVILFVLGSANRPVFGRRHWF
jgi:uncharacterized membrane protein HdeD (DUF308 family)